MRKVKNKGVLRNLAAKSYRANRTRNLIAAMAIALTAILFTALFTVGLGMVETIEQSNMRQSGGDAHGVIKGITEEQYEIFRKNPLIRECTKNIFCAYGVENPEFLKRHVELHYVAENWYPHWFLEIQEGKAPKAADEILLDETSMILLGLDPVPGQQVTLDLRIHPTDTETVSRTFTVTGVLEVKKSGMDVGFAIVSDAYLEQHREELANRSEEWDSVGLINMDIVFSSSRNIQEKLNQIITESGFSTDVDAENFVDSNANWAYMSEASQSDPTTMAALAGVLLLILVAGYLIIYNIFQISVLRDIRYYGLLKTIGTTGRQTKRLLRWQAMRLFLMGTPIGLILGFFVGKFLLPIIAKVGSYEEASINVSPKPWIFVGAALFTLLTVFLSQWKPGRIAAKVSPIEAVRYTEQGRKHKREKRSTGGGRIWRMAVSNLGRNRRRTAIVIASLSLTVILLNSVYTVTHSVDREGMLSKMILCEDIIGNAALWNYDYRPIYEEEAAEVSLSKSFAEAVQQQEAYLDGGRLFMASMKMLADSWEIPTNIPTNEEGAPVDSYYGDVYDGYETGAYWVNYYGMDEFCLSKMTIVEGEEDKDVIWEKLQTGDYLLYAVDVDDNNQVIEERYKHHAGDTVTLEFGDGETKEYEVLSVVKCHQYSLMNRMVNQFPYYVSAEEFLRHYSEDFQMSLLLDTKEGYEEEMEAFLKEYTTNVEPAMSYESRETFGSMFQQMLGTITIVGTALAVFLGLIGVLNFLNTMLTSVVTRRREFAMMEAVGMTGKQLVGMLTLEGLFYAVFTIAASLIVGSIVSLTLIRGLGGGLWFLRYRFTLLPMVVAVPVLLILGGLVPALIHRFLKEDSLVERMREE